MSTDIAALKARVSALNDELDVAQTALREALIAEAEFKVGDVVEVTFFRNRGLDTTKLAIIRDVEPNSWRTSYRVSYQNKGGEWSKNIQHVYGSMRLAPAGDA